MIAAPLVQTHGLTKRYGPLAAVDDLDLRVEPGVVGLVGSNGAGKSTLLKMLLGLLEPTSGSASVLGLDVAAQGPALRALVGYMPEHDCLPPDVSATELVVHLARISGLTAAAARERTADTLRHVGLHEERYRPIGGYSTGMRQRVKLAQALVHDPALVMLDEPTNGLDPAGRTEMLALVRRVGVEFGIAVLVTSHLLGELEQVCDTVVVLDGGRLERVSTTAEMTAATSVLVVELDAGAGEVAAALSAAGVEARSADERRLEVDLTGASRGPTVDRAYDAVRDAVAERGLALVSLGLRRHRMAEVFEEAGHAHA